MIAPHIRRRLLKGIGANLYGQAIVAVIQLAGVPILLHAWGAKTYGEWLILFAIPGYLSMTNLGFSISAANDMTAQVARGNRTEALAVFQSIAVLITVTSFIAFLVVAILIWTLPIEYWLHLGTMGPVAIRLVLLLLCSDILVLLFDGLNHAGFRANGEYALHTAISNTTPLIQQLVLWTMVLTGHGPLAAAFGFLAVRLIMVPGTAIFLVVRHPWLGFGFRYARISELRRLSLPALGNLAIPLAQSMNMQGMILVVASVLGPIAVVTFSVLRTLTRLALQLVSTVSYAAEAEFAALDRGGKGAPLELLYDQTMRLSLWISATVVIGLAIFAPTFVCYWTGGHVLMEPWLFGWLLGTVFSQTLWNGALSMLKARNRHVGAAGAQVVAAAGALLMAGLLLEWSRNISYAGLALFVSDVAFMLFTMAAVRRVLGISVGATLLAALDPRPLRTLIWRAGNA
jgi:O-antigen/teichoic acid export membrane protein